MMFGVWLVTNLAALRLFAKELKKQNAEQLLHLTIDLTTGHLQ